MALFIQQARIEKLTISLADRNNGTGSIGATGTVELIGPQGAVVVRQDFNGYSGIKVEWSHETVQQMDALIEYIRADIERTMGITQL